MNINIVKSSLLAACIVGTSSYLSGTSHPLLAGFLIAVPVALPSLWFVNNKNESSMKEYIKGFSISITSYCIAALFFYYMVVKLNYEKKNMIIAAMVVWFTLVCIAYFIFN